MAILHARIIGEGKPLLILHGFLGMSDNWKTLGNKYAEKGFQVHLIDQRNHGRSFHSEHFSYSLMAGDLLEYIRHHQLEKISVIGHSMGGKTTMFFAITYPEYIDRILIADIAPKYYPVHHQDILDGLSALDFNLLKSRREVDQKLAAYIPETGTRQFLLKNLYWVQKEVLGLRMNLPALVTNIEHLGMALPQNAIFRGKTLFLRGSRSDYIKTEDQQTIFKHFPSATIGTIENSGHWLHAENPKSFYDQSLLFLNHPNT